MPDPISRRSAIFRAFATVAAGSLFSFDMIDNSIQSAKRNLIVPGETFGTLELEMTSRDITRILGNAESQSSFPGGTWEERRQLLNLIELNRESVDVSDEDIELLKTAPLSNPCTYFTFESKGVAVRFEDGTVTSIIGYTGIPSGYQKGEYNSCFALNEIADVDCPVETLEDVVRLYGKPDSESPLKHSPIPNTTYSYNQGIAFSGRLDDGRISNVVIKTLK